MVANSPPLIAESDETAETLAILLKDGLADLERRVRAGQPGSCESTFAEYPRLAANKDARLELIYTEYVLRQDLGHEPSLEEWQARFPDWRDEIRLLFEVNSCVEESAANVTLRDSKFDSWWFDGCRPLPQPGQYLSNYELLEELGQGGMGTVYRARQQPLQRQVALKTLHASGNAEALSRFRVEAEASSRLQHPNIVQVYEVGADSDRPYFTMEYIAGGNLAAVIRQRPLPALTAAQLLAPLARAVHYAHEHGVVHRDIKPANILLASSERAEAVQLGKYAVGREPDGSRFELKITDFGLAKCADLGTATTQSHALLGTPSYMAPEQAQPGASTVGRACDIYALGAVLYDMLVGRPPFHAATVAETLQRLQHDDPVSIRNLQPTVPRDLETICLKCLHKDPARRYFSAAELAEDLERFLRQEPVRARPIGIMERGQKWIKRYPALAALAASLVLGAIGISSEWYRAEVNRAQAEKQAQLATQARDAVSIEHERVERTLYAHDISLANLEYHSNNTARAAQLLAACPAELRNWEWHYLQRVVQQELCEFSGFSQQVRSVAISRDGRFTAAASATWGVNRQGEVRLWDTTSGKLLHRFTEHPSSVMDVEFDPTGKRLVSSGVTWGKPTGGGVYLWDVPTGEKLWSQPHFRSHTATFSPDGSQLAVGHTDGKITLHDAESGRLLRTTARQQGVIFDLSFRHDGQFLASASRDGSFQVWDIFGDDPTIVGGLSDVRRVSYSPDGHSLAVGMFSGTIRIYEQDGSQWAETLAHHVGERIGGMKFSPDGQYLAVTALDQGLRFLDVKTGRSQRELHGHNGTTMDLSFSDDGRFVATGGLDGNVKVWDLTEHPSSKRRIIPGPFLTDLACVPGSRLVAVATAFNNSGIRKHERPTLKIWNLEQGEFMHVLTGHAGWLTSVAADPQGRWVLTGSEDKTAILWDARQPAKLRTLAGHAQTVSDVAFLERGNLAATVAGGEVRFWNPSDGSEQGRWKAKQGKVTCLVGHPTRPLVAAALAGELVLLDAANLSLRQRFESESVIRHLTFSSDGAWLAVAREDGTIDLWRVDNAIANNRSTPLTRMTGHTGAVTSVGFSPDGQRLASSSADRTVKLWDVVSGQEVMSLPGAGLAGMLSKIAFSADGLALMQIDQNALDIWEIPLSEAPVPANSSPKRLQEWYKRESQRAVDGGHWFAVAQHSEALTRLSPESSDHLALHGLALAHLGQAEQAIDKLQAALARTASASAFYHLMLLKVQRGDVLGYDDAAESYLSAYGSSQNALEVNNAIWACTLGGNFVKDHPDVVTNAERVAAEMKSPEALNTLGAVYLRAGQPSDALLKLREGITKRGSGLPHDWILLALTHAALNESEQAVENLRLTQEWLAKQNRRHALRLPDDPQDTWATRLELEILIREAEQVVAKTDEAARSAPKQ